MSRDAPGITFRHLTKRYGAVTALDHFSAEVWPGRITAFLGGNGSGNTTSMDGNGQALLGAVRAVAEGGSVWPAGGI